MPDIRISKPSYHISDPATDLSDRNQLINITHEQSRPITQSNRKRIRDLLTEKVCCDDLHIPMYRHDKLFPFLCLVCKTTMEMAKLSSSCFNAILIIF